MVDIYVEYMATVANLLGTLCNTTTKMREIMDFEKKLAKVNIFHIFKSSQFLRSPLPQMVIVTSGVSSRTFRMDLILYNTRNEALLCVINWLLHRPG